MIKTYYNRIKNYFKRKKGGIPGGFYEKIILDVFVKFLLELFSKIINPIIRKKKLRHKDLEKERNILLNHLNSATLKYHDSLETFLHFVYHLADHDVPYYQDYQSTILCIQKKFSEKTRLSPYIHRLKDGVGLKHSAEETNLDEIRKALNNQDASEDFRKVVNRFEL